MSLPDFRNGYFLGPVSWTISIHAAQSPRLILMSGNAAEVVMLGADGGGTMYGLVPLEGNAVFSLPQDSNVFGHSSWGAKTVAWTTASGFT